MFGLFKTRVCRFELKINILILRFIQVFQPDFNEEIKVSIRIYKQIYYSIASY